jgi:hypothetical protein
VIAGGAERGKPTAVAGSPGVYRYTFCTPLAAVATFRYHGRGTEPAGNCPSTAVANSGVISIAAWDAFKGSLDLAASANATTRVAIAGRDGAIVDVVQDFAAAQLPTLLTATANEIATDESCGASHNVTATRAHFASNTVAPIGESCNTCHGPGAAYEVHK